MYKKYISLHIKLMGNQLQIVVHFTHELMQSCGVRRPSVLLSVCLSVCKLCANRFFYQTNEMAGSRPNLHTMVPRRACIQGVLKVKVEVKRQSLHGETVCQTVSCTVRSHVRSLHALTL